MAKNCTYSFSGPDGRRTVLRGEAAIKAWLVAGGLEYLRGAASDAQASRARGITDTPEFKAWFGDSKVVDSEGKPLVVYHGTSRSFPSFRPSKRGNFGPGIYFAGTADQAENFAYGDDGGDNIVPVYLAMQNPYRTAADYAAGEAVDVDSPAVPLIEGVFGSDANRAIARLRNSDDGHLGPAVRDRLLEMGHDGIIATYPDGSAEYVAFFPEQIKSATGNRGTFDPTNPDITRSSERDLDSFRKELLSKVQANMAMGKMRAAAHDWAFNVGDQLLSTKTGKVYRLVDRTFQRVGKLSANDWQPVYYYESGRPPPAGATRQEQDEWPHEYERGTFHEARILESSTLKSLTTPIMRSAERGITVDMKAALEAEKPAKAAPAAEKPAKKSAPAKKAPAAKKAAAPAAPATPAAAPEAEKA